MDVNFGKVSADYAKYRDHYPEMFFEQLGHRGISFEDAAVIDLGAGSGIFSRDLWKQGAQVVGIEPSRELIAEAVSIGESEGVAGITYQQASAENFVLTRKYRFFTAARAWHWFEREQVIQNIKRYMEEDGVLIVTNSIFKPDSEIAQMTFDVLRANEIALKPAGSQAAASEKRSGFPVNWFQEWESHGLVVACEWQHDYTLPFTHEEWCGKIRSVSWLTNSDAAQKTKITHELMARLSAFAEILTVPHQFSVVVLTQALQASP